MWAVGRTVSHGRSNRDESLTATLLRATMGEPAVRSAISDAYSLKINAA
jgi:hypothetical protein